MHLATIRVKVEVVPGFRSKHRSVRAILEKLHRHLNVTVAELDGEAHASQATLGFGAMAITRREVRQTLERVAAALEAHPRVRVLEVKWTDH